MRSSRDRCEGCQERAPDGWPDIRLRVSGWHIFEGKLFASDKKVRRLICPMCLKKPRIKPPDVQEGQTELF